MIHCKSQKVGTKYRKNEDNNSFIKRKRYNKLFLDTRNIPSVTLQTLRRWQNYIADFEQGN